MWLRMVEWRDGIVHARPDLVAHVGWAQRHDAMHGKARHRRIGGFDVRQLLAGFRIESALIAHLAAGFGVERRLVEHQLGARAGLDALHQLLIDQQADHAGVRFQMRRSRRTSCGLFRAALIGRRDHALLGALPTRARALALLLHLALEAFAIDGQAALARHLFLLVERQAVGVVELERDGARHAPRRRAISLRR